jgi:hypothetical protein
MNKLILVLTLFAALALNPKATLAQDATDSADTIRNKVREKIEGVLKNPKAYLGTITDKTGETLQIKNREGEIEFISVNPEEASFVSVGKTSKAIKFTDVAIGDFIVAMGFLSEDGNSTGAKNGSEVLDARRILVTEAPGSPERKIVFGTVAKIEKKVITVTTDEKEVQAEFPKNWKGPEIKEIAENDNVALVTVPKDEKTLVRTIEITQKSEAPSPTAEE